jgi:hypothetical protein
MALWPAHDFATYLAGTLTHPSPPGGSTVLTYAAGGNLLVGPVRPESPTVPVVCVFVEQSGGDSPMPYLGEAASFYVSQITATIRGGVDTFEAGEALARSIITKMHATQSLTGYVYCLALASDPVYTGTNESGSHEWQAAFRVSAKK